MRVSRLQIFLSLAVALNRREQLHLGADAFRIELLATSATTGRNNDDAPSVSRLGRTLFRHSQEVGRYQLRTNIILNQQSSSATEATEFPQKFPRKRRIKYGGGRGRGNWNNRPNLPARSRAVLNSFEEVCQRERINRSLQGDSFISMLNSMAEDLLDGNDIISANRREEADKNDNSEESHNLSQHLLPRDASSLIRLLGRNGVHDAMLKLCRRYCHDIINVSKSSEHNNKSNGNRPNGDRSNRNRPISRSDAEEAVLFAYTAAIAACSKPPPTSLALSKEPHLSTTNPKYRSKSFLLSLLGEMEHDYTEDGRSIRPNSYTLSAVLLGIDDAVEALGVLEQFEGNYVKCIDNTDEGQEQPLADHTVVTVQVYNVVIASCSKDFSSNGSGWQRALSILQRMRRSGPQPNEQTYSLILQACAEDRQMKVAMSLVDEIRQSPLITPTAKFYIPLLKVCAKSGNYKTAWSLITIMKEDKLELSTEIMNLYLSALAKGKMHLMALGLLQDMISDPALVPDLVTFNTVLSACANADDFEGAQALLEQMKDGGFAFPSANGQKNMAEIRPDVVSYNSLISCADPEAALALIQEMRLTRRNREGVVFPNSVTYVNAITQCRNASFKDDPMAAFEIAMYLLELAREEKNGKGIDLNVFVYSSAIWMAEAVGDCQTAVQLLRGMKCPPNSVCYDGVISSLSQRGLHREALYFYYEMQNLELSATRKTYQKLVFAIDNSRDLELARSCQKKGALLEGVRSVMPGKDKQVQIGGPLFESLIKNHGCAADTDASYQASRMAFDSIKGPVDDACLSAMLRVCSSVNPAKWNEALTLIHSSDIVSEVYGPGLVSKHALSFAVIACAKADQWEESLKLIQLYGHKPDNTNQSIHERILDTKSNGIVSIGAVNSVIRACGRSSRPDVAVQLLNDMEVKYGVLPNEISYRLAIIACNQAEHREARHPGSSTDPGLQWWECALSLHRRMRDEDDIKPSLQTFSSVVSACEAAGQWQRAVGVLESMPYFSPLLGEGEMETNDAPEPANLYCVNAAISACEKGGAWVEALQLYENILTLQVRPNFITVNSLLIALEKANQLELAQSIYNDALRDKIVSPWKRRYDNDGKLRNMMDLHKFSAPMAKIAVRSYMESLLSSRTKGTNNGDAVFIVGKGKRSEERPVLMPTVLGLFHEELGIEATIDGKNAGRIRVAKEDLEKFVERKNWKT